MCPEVLHTYYTVLHSFTLLLWGHFHALKPDAERNEHSVQLSQHSVHLSALFFTNLDTF